MKRAIRRLTLISDAPHFGGAERYALSMIKAASDQGAHAGVLWLQPESRTPHVFAGRVGMDQLITLPAERIACCYSMTREVHSLLRDQRPDGLIINACGRARFWLVPWIARCLGIPSLWVHHMVDGRDPRRLAPLRLGGRMEGLGMWRWRQTFRHRAAAAGASAVIASNSRDAEMVMRSHGLRQREVQVIPPGIDADQFSFKSDVRTVLRRQWNTDGGATRAFVIGSAGRMVAGKRFDLVIEAVAQLRQSGIPAMAVLAGDGETRDELVRHAERAGISDHIRFLRHVDDMAGYYSALDVFVLCSETESFGLVLTEAMACERPVIATPTAGARSQILPGDTGVLLKSWNAEELADEIAALYRDSVQAVRMGHSGRAHVQSHFTIGRTLDRCMRLLKTAGGNGAQGQSLEWTPVGRANPLREVTQGGGHLL